MNERAHHKSLQLHEDNYKGWASPRRFVFTPVRCVAASRLKCWLEFWNNKQTNWCMSGIIKGREKTKYTCRIIPTENQLHTRKNKYSRRNLSICRTLFLSEQTIYLKMIKIDLTHDLSFFSPREVIAVPREKQTNKQKKHLPSKKCSSSKKKKGLQSL